MALAAAVLGGCGGGSKSSSTSTSVASTTSQSTTTTTSTAPAPSKLVQRVVEVGAPKGTTPPVKPGAEVVISVRTPSSADGKRLTVGFNQAGPAGFAVTSSVAGAPLKARARLKAATAGLQLVSLEWVCKLPAETFCPVTAKSAGASAQLQLKAGPNPVVLIARIDRPGSVPVPKLHVLAPPAPSAPVTATIKLEVTSSKASGHPTAATTVSAGAGSEVVGIVRAANGSPAGATLRISIPNTSGKTIAVHAGGTASSPSATATITSGSSIRVSDLSYTCKLPPATFCPMKVKQTATGLLLTLPTPVVPVVFKLGLAAA
jgi:hypothetical protein